MTSKRIAGAEVSWWVLESQLQIASLLKTDDHSDEGETPHPPKRMGALLIAALAVDEGYSLQTTALGPETYSNLKAFLGIESHCLKVKN